MRYRLDDRVEILDEGRVLLGGDPTKLLRLSDAGARVVRSWSGSGVDVESSTAPSVRALVGRLVDNAMAHPEPVPGVGAIGNDETGVAVVVPVRDRPAALGRCLAALVASGVTDIVVVDDGSADGSAHDAVAASYRAFLVRRDHSGGPAAARMSGWRAVMSRPRPPELVAFVDSDIEVTPDWRAAVVGHFDAPDVGLVAPRVRHVAGTSLVDRYEAANSPLDLGGHPALIVAGTRVSYVPAATVLVRSDAFADVGGFDEALHVGEDVDLVWRLADAGWRCRYEPRSVVVHRGRSTLAAMLRRRFDYGRSAAALDARHPGALPPVRGSAWSAAVMGVAAAGHPVAAAGIAGWTVREMARKLDNVPGAPRLAARLVLRGHLAFARQVARAAVRPWFPIALALSLVSRRVRRLVVAGALVAPSLAWRERRPALGLPLWTGLFLADDVAYSAGLWAGSLRWGNRGALVPSIRPHAKIQN